MSPPLYSVTQGPGASFVVIGLQISHINPGRNLEPLPRNFNPHQPPHIHSAFRLSQIITMSSFDSDPNNFNNTSYNNSQPRRGGFDDQYGSSGTGGFDQQTSGRGRFDDNSYGGGGYDQDQYQQSGRANQFSSSGYNDDSFGTSQTQRGYGAGNERGYGDTTGTQGYGTGNDFENSRTGTGSAYGTGNDFSTGRDDDSYGSSNTTKPSFGDKMKGTAEVAAGKLTRNPDMVERGQERKVEGNNF
ncbi:hypothetical protein C8R42DRAFT_258476 [Lentinula raphanica]|nr:hypothetical protein C8R42DRAFT_258476 [Lentinula raphanica]